MPQSDDGVVIARGTIEGRPVVVASIEQGFQGGGTGEVSGAKISQALQLAARDTRNGRVTAAVLLLETGGVRLQEANLGLNAVAEICSAVLDLRRMAPVVGVVAGLCTRLIVTPQGRIGLNGPAVIEQEAGVDEFDSSDRALIWSVDGGERRAQCGLADTLVYDDADLLRAAVSAAIAAGVPGKDAFRSRRRDALAASIEAVRPQHVSPADPTQPTSRGHVWMTSLTRATPLQVIPSVIRADDPDATYLAVVPDPRNPFHRARHGEVGLTEALALADAVDDVVCADAAADKRAIVAVVDLPSQAYGRIEETTGLHQAIPATVDAYHRARNAGHPIVAVVVGSALSGGFLAHGLQAQRILALDDPGVRIHAMHESAAARITQRIVDELERLAKTILPLSFDVRDWAQLGMCDGLLSVLDADHPSAADVAAVREAIGEAIAAARTGPRDLSNRLDSPGAVQNRNASRTIRATMAEQWPPA